MLFGLVSALKYNQILSRVVSKLNASNPPDHQYDVWGNPLFGPWWMRFDKAKLLFQEYRAKFGDDDLMRNKRRVDFIVAAVGVVVLLPLGLVWVFGR
jgi:hypothetical protein